MKINILGHWQWTFIHLKWWIERVPQSRHRYHCTHHKPTLVSTCPPSFFIWYKSRRLGAFTVPLVSFPTCTLLLGPLVTSVFLSEVSCDVVKRLGWLSLPRTWSSGSFWNFQSAQQPAQVHKLPSCTAAVTTPIPREPLGSPRAEGAWAGDAGEPPQVDSGEKQLWGAPSGEVGAGELKRMFPSPRSCSLLLLSRWRLFLTQPGQSQHPDHWFEAVLWPCTGDLRWGIWCRLHSHPVTVVFKTSLGPTIRNTCDTQHLVFTHIITHTTEAKTLYTYSYIYKVHCIKFKKKKGFMAPNWFHAPLLDCQTSYYQTPC